MTRNQPSKHAVTTEEVESFARDFTAFINLAHGLLDPKHETVGGVLRNHLGPGAERFPVVAESFAFLDHVNVQRAFEHLTNSGEIPLTWGGIVGDHRWSELKLATMIGGEKYTDHRIGPVTFRNQPSGVGSTSACVALGWAIGTLNGAPFGLLVQLGEQHGPMGRVIRIEVVSKQQQTAEKLLRQLRDLKDQLNVYRGQMLSLTACDDGSIQIDFLARDKVKRQDIVMPKGVLESIERHVIDIGRHRESLLALGQHLKRGVLLHGAPGTGKTMTIRYLASRLVDTTVIVLTGRALAAVKPSAEMARMLHPALLVIEDVDLIAEERHQPGMESNPLLFTLLNEMDGISGDADVAFLLTTNRADLLEPALAQRPGRIDLAVEVPLPDAACRRRLLRRYGAPLGLSFAESGDLVASLDGVAASFIKELLRKAALAALVAGETVTEDHVRAALAELVSERASLTRTIIGAGSDAAMK
jgi:cell division protease FtsH